MSEQHTRIRGESAPGRRGTRRRSRRDTAVDSEAMREKLDREFRARIQKKLQEGAGQDEEDAPSGPNVAGKVRSKNLQKQLEEIQLEERVRVSQDGCETKAAAEETRVRLSSDELLEDLPVAEEVEEVPAEIAEPKTAATKPSTDDSVLPETEIDGPKPLPSNMNGTIVLPKSTSGRGRRSQVMRVDGGTTGSQRAEVVDGEAPPKGMRMAFKFLGVLLFVFFAALAYRWIALGRAPSDLVTVEGQAELASEVRALAASPPVAPAADASAQPDNAAQKSPAGHETKSSEEEAVVSSPWDSPKGSAPKPAKPKGPGEQYTLAPQKRTGGRSAEPLTRTFTEKHPGLAAARDAFAQADVPYTKSDPRSNAFDTVQKNLRLAIPLLEKCLDECDKARKKGIKAAELDAIEQNASMRLYDCRKRSTVQP